MATATYYNTEAIANNSVASGVRLVATAAASVVFNSASLSGTTLSATFVNTTNGTSFQGLSSGTGTIEIDGSYAGATFGVTMADRTSFTFTVPTTGARTSNPVTLTSAGYGAVGPTFVRLRNQGQI
jgi:hypothetical protein